MSRSVLFFIFLSLIPLLPSYASAEQSSGRAKTATSCSQPETRQFDFWIGEWDLSWGTNGKGTNIIRSTLDGCVVREEFDGTPSIQLRGISVSTFNSSFAKWQQTWVDNQGNYLDFIGEFKDGRMVLQRKATFEGKEILQRMVWYNITKNRLDWNWERSEDGGRSWKVLWQISYKRRDSGEVQ